MKKNFCTLLLLCFACNASLAQLSVGPFLATNSIPAIPLHVPGGGVTAEVAGHYNFSLAYFGKTFSEDSAYYPKDDGSPGYLYYQERSRILHLSASFSAYILGGRSSEEKFSAYVSAGLAGLYRMHQIGYTGTYSPPEDKVNKFIFGFSFSAGIDYNLGSVKPFLRGNANILLQHVIPGSYDTALPLLSNTQLGLLIPF